MPQMAPLAWLNLYLTFTILFFCVLIMNFYTKLPKKLHTINNKTSCKKTNWKW